MTRHGKHKDGNVLLGAMVEPRKKAIAILTAAAVAANGSPISQSDLIWKGIENLAMAYGVLDKNGDVTPEYSDAFLLTLSTVVGVNRSNRGTRGGRRAAK